ncbi:MAG: hypothetical protein J6S91_05165, partial [Treponema sp.]|nr:hypothetical protein [Treponema sp.]
VMTSCGAMASVLSEAWCLDNNTYAVTYWGNSVRLAFKMEDTEYQEKLTVTVDGDTLSGYGWILDPGEAVAEVKNIFIYKDGNTNDHVIGTLKPDGLNPSELEVIDHAINFGTVILPVGTVFNKVYN